MPHLPSTSIHHHDGIAAALQESGACLLTGFPAQADALREDLLRLQASDVLQRASVGRAKKNACWTISAAIPPCGWMIRAAARPPPPTWHNWMPCAAD